MNQLFGELKIYHCLFTNFFCWKKMEILELATMHVPFFFITLVCPIISATVVGDNIAVLQAIIHSNQLKLMVGFELRNF